MIADTHQHYWGCHFSYTACVICGKPLTLADVLTQGASDDD